MGYNAVTLCIIRCGRSLGGAERLSSCRCTWRRYYRSGRDGRAATSRRAGDFVNAASSSCPVHDHVTQRSARSALLVLEGVLIAGATLVKLQVRSVCPPSLRVVLRNLCLPQTPKKLPRGTMSSSPSHAPHPKSSPPSSPFAPWSPRDNVLVVTAWRAGDADDIPFLVLELKTGQLSRRREVKPVTVVLAALQALASEHLEELDVCGVGPGASWPGAWEHARGLRRLAVDGAAALAFCASPDVLPALSEPTISGADFKERPDEAPHVLSDALPLCLAGRAHAGHILRELDVSGCSGLDDVAVRKLQEVVPGGS
ncbi:hypothetical protein FA95DRAFT_1402398 [Auriscalpium vulgare]|uniref:Uncharacterized protein n=1 Tax=Auriscalpium vulgare TaxID=40419 RepID=A0ACB8RQC6_9AGAM|nr:hypothetical protein FA95DRAFT_1402398 [Auriscalpium vulgare]